MRRWPLVLLCLVGLTLGMTGTASAAEPTANRVPGGTTPSGARPQAARGVPTCVDENMCTIVKDTSNAPSCTGYSSQTAPPATIRVLVRTGDNTGTYTITNVRFKQYVEDVLPNEWLSSWDGDALKAGAVAVKSYAWYWATHFGGYIHGDRKQCFDVTDDYLFQTYLPGTATARTNTAVTQTWPVAARVGGKILQTSYQSYLKSSTEGCGAGADGRVLSQYGSQACNEANTGNKYNVILAKYYYPGLRLATVRQRRTAHDFRFLATSTRAVFHAGDWVIDDGYPTKIEAGTAFHYGTAGDLPVITDAGDGFAHAGVFRPATGTWYIATPTGSTNRKVVWGRHGDIPVPAHYEGVGAPTVLAVYRPANRTWYLRGQGKYVYGAKGDIPVPGHYAGTAANDYADGIAMFRPSNGTWYVRGRKSVHYGARGDIPVPADYDGNGTTDIAVYRPSTHTFYVRGHAWLRYGVKGDIPVTGDFTGDGKADLAVYRPSNHTWYVHGQPAVAFGAAGDTPIGTAPYRG